jgi:uncharacterized membrane-anchored protein
MIRSRVGLITALLFPIVILLLLTAYKRHILTSGHEVIFPISGYDPRNLLSGHYITYRVDYGVDNLCAGIANIQQAYVCLAPKVFSLTLPKECQLYIRGTCHVEQFRAGIEKYYIPENKAQYLDKQIRNKMASIVISVMPNGNAQVKNLLINGKVWH